MQIFVINPPWGALCCTSRSCKDERQFSDGFYSKSLLFVQSSGAGKSRLADAFGEIFPMISYVIRKDLNGFPPRDKEILDFMQSNPSSAQEEFMSSPSKSLTDVERSERGANIWHHAVSVGILQASFEICKEPPTHLSPYC
jgi:hypothetical protein